MVPVPIAAVALLLLSDCHLVSARSQQGDTLIDRSDRPMRVSPWSQSSERLPTVNSHSDEDRTGTSVRRQPRFQPQPIRGTLAQVWCPPEIHKDLEVLHTNNHKSLCRPIRGALAQVWTIPSGCPGTGVTPAHQKGVTFWANETLWAAYLRSRDADARLLKYSLGGSSNATAIVAFELYLADAGVWGPEPLHRLELVLAHFYAHGIRPLLFLLDMEFFGTGTWATTHDIVHDQQAREYVLRAMRIILGTKGVTETVDFVSTYWVGQSARCNGKVSVCTETEVASLISDLQRVANSCGATYLQHVDGPFWNNAQNVSGYSARSLAHAQGVIAESWAMGTLLKGVSSFLAANGATRDTLLLLNDVPNCDLVPAKLCSTGSVKNDTATWFGWLDQLGLADTWGVWDFVDAGGGDANQYGDVMNDGSGLTTKGMLHRERALSRSHTKVLKTDDLQLHFSAIEDDLQIQDDGSPTSVVEMPSVMTESCPFHLWPGTRLDGASHLGPELNATSVDECCQLCVAAVGKDCKAFEFLVHQRKCWLKRGVGRTSACGKECISGTLQVPPAPAPPAPSPPPTPASTPGATPLGVVGYGGGESSLVSFNGHLFLVDSPAWCFPWHMRFDNETLGKSCVSYIRVVDMATGDVISNITESCQHTFGAAFAHDGTFYVYATRCARYEQPHPWCERPDAEDQATCDCWHGYGGNVSQCAVDVFWSTDLKEWQTRAAFFPGTRLANVDVAAVPGRSDMKFIMIWEQGDLIATNSSTPIDGWRHFSDLSVHGPHIGCPSIKYLADERTFYVVGGGKGVHAFRSTDLRNWTAAHHAVATCGHSHALEDERTIDYPGLFTWNPPVRFGVDFAAFMRNNTNGWDRDASDLDLVQWENTHAGRRENVTLLVYICGNQRTDGFGTLSVFNGSMGEYFAQLWDENNLKR